MDSAFNKGSKSCKARRPDVFTLGKCAYAMAPKGGHANRQDNTKYHIQSRIKGTLLLY
jgi:hypothetical protein